MDAEEPLMLNHNWIKIKETPDWIIDYDIENNSYRISYFEDGHFKDEVIFVGYTSTEKE